MIRSGREFLLVWFCAVVGPVMGRSQGLSPPIAEYRGRANGALELRNDSDVPLAAILELRGFSLDAEGNLRYGPLNPRINVELGSNSFIIPPHQAHYVFYRATSTRLPVWFAIMNNLTRATPVAQGLRVNVILPHLVYIYQKPKFKEQDLEVRIFPGGRSGEYRLELINRSEKLTRVEAVDCKGFEVNQTYGGFPLFPGQSRSITLEAGEPSTRARFRIRFQDGLRLNRFLTASASSLPP